MQDNIRLEKQLEVVEKRVGRILVCKLKNGHMFSAMLVSVSPDGMLMFENSNGSLISDRLEDIAEFNEYKPRCSVPKSTSFEEV